MEVPDSEARAGRAMIDPRVIDPDADLVARAHLAEAEVDEIVGMMTALRAWREADERMSAASRQYMKLNQNDMRAVRYLMACENAGELATARALAEHLGISSAATTKMLDRLERGGHVRRLPHPADRRSIVLQITPETRRSARAGVGRLHARRFEVGARMTSQERRVVTRFLRDLAATENAEGSERPAPERPEDSEPRGSARPGSPEGR
ncbi:MarR family winged helix-turn-helix transcriptional regulator [uncultured Microbacterium sp.]|uniref:MarR family winged helix-turn-helix transcriptional regulator n=1 Tax=uncultured Microbacterium sp. TaxID=191216 RepID=UPI0025E988A8|nr:MarR family transcriptional regulator [uncultured Microbacterium sp.]